MTPGPLSARTLLAVALGGAVGGLLRWSVGLAAPDTAFPWPTFVVNVSGTFALALLVAVPAMRARPLLGAALGPGLLGGYTTLSAYAEETRALLADAEPALASGYLVGSIATCVLAVVLARRLTTTGDDTR